MKLPTLSALLLMFTLFCSSPLTKADEVSVENSAFHFGFKAGYGNTTDVNVPVENRFSFGLESAYRVHENISVAFEISGGRIHKDHQLSHYLVGPGLRWNSCG